VTPRWLFPTLVVLSVGLVVANAVLSACLTLEPVPAQGAPEIATVWRQGALVGRQVVQGDARAAFAADLAQLGTTLIAERVAYEGRVLTFDRRLFAMSFLAGRDGVHAAFGGRDAYLAPQDLVRAHLYRGGSDGRWVGPVAGLDADGVLAALAKELGCSPEQLLANGRLTRFTVAQTVTANEPEEKDAIRLARRETVPTGGRLMVGAEDAAKYLNNRLPIDGRFPDLVRAAPNGARGYDWQAHAAITLFLAETGTLYENHLYKSAARRAAWALQKAATLKCDADDCIGEGDHVDVMTSALALAAYSEIARQKTGAPFLEPARQLSAFLRSQQLVDGGFSSGYDRAARRSEGAERGDVDAAAVLALARSNLATKASVDLEAAELGLAHLTGRPGAVGPRDYLGADYRVCDAVEDLWQRAPNPSALEFCQTWTTWNLSWQMEPRGPTSAFAGGFRRGASWVPDVVTTANHVEGMIATIQAELRSGVAAAGVRDLDVAVTRGLEFLLREQLAGARAPETRDPEAVLGAFSTGPFDSEPSSVATAAAGSAMLRLLAVLETRGMPSPKKVKQDSARLAIPND
jgi:hypothetical protein